MTTGDEHDWAPPGAGTPASSGDAWAPSTAPPPPEPVAGPPIATPAATPMPTPPAITAADSVEIEPVEASPRRRGVFGRVAAAGVAALMLGGGAALVLNAASADSGAESPEAAFEAAMAAVESEDLVALAEIMEPSERDTVFEAGFDFVDELVRLDVLDPGVDLSSIEGIDLEFEGFEPRVERPGNGLAHVYVGEGTVSGSIDVAALPLGPLLVDRLDEEQLTFSDTAQEAAGPTTTPLVAVERDGRWYLSLWYTVAENVRLEFDAGLPDLTRRPATIGGATPEDAVRQMMDDAVQLDLRRVIGSLDPEEMAVLYDYAPLFLDEADEAANELLRAATDAGWSWEIVDLGLRSEADGDLASVFLESMHFRADAQNGGLLDLRIGPDEVGLEFVIIDDFFESEMRVAVTLDGDCVVVVFDEGRGPQEERVCGSDLGLDEGGFGEIGEQFDTFGMVTRQVDGVWYLSPIRTGLDAMVTAIEQVEPEMLQEFADELLAFGLDGAMLGPDFESMLPIPGGAVDEDEFFAGGFSPLSGVQNADLLAEQLDPAFAWDLDAADAASEAGFWIPGFADLAFERGVYATVSAPGGGGDVVVVSLEVADSSEAQAAFEQVAEVVGADIEARAAFGPFVLETVDPYGGPMFVESYGVRVVIVAGYGASVEDLRWVLDQQSGT